MSTGATGAKLFSPSSKEEEEKLPLPVVSHLNMYPFGCPKRERWVIVLSNTGPDEIIGLPQVVNF